MNYIITDENHVITAMSTGLISISNGIIVDDIPANVEPMKWCFTAEKGFYENPDYVPRDILSGLKGAKIAESKTKLAEWLANNPLLYSDGKYYSVTEEKQSLLNGNLASYERAKSMGIDYDLKWNATEQPCEPWSQTDLLTLSLNIAGYVAPKVSMQQSYEIRIKNCSSIEEIDSIVIDYDRNGDESETNS